uniref:Uncharacterized protein n=1 Tax=uncultured marine virus TaxID=186617 RepID=S4TF31_9VIRU|nr:hypothetical protein [uncultured marine virus]
MAKAKTGSFYIRRDVDCSATSPGTLTIDTSAYVDPADRQGLMIQEVDFIFYNSATNLPFLTANEATAAQLLSGAYTTMQPYSEEDLIASGGIVHDSGSGVFAANDVFPDVLGTQDGRIVVDDQMSLLGKSASAFANCTCTVIIKAKVVTLSNKDYMALALQTVAN